MGMFSLLSCTHTHACLFGRVNTREKNVVCQQVAVPAASVRQERRTSAPLFVVNFFPAQQQIVNNNPAHLNNNRHPDEPQTNSLYILFVRRFCTHMYLVVITELSNASLNFIKLSSKQKWHFLASPSSTSLLAITAQNQRRRLRPPAHAHAPTLLAQVRLVLVDPQRQCCPWTLLYSTRSRSRPGARVALQAFFRST